MRNTWQQCVYSTWKKRMFYLPHWSLTNLNYIFTLVLNWIYLISAFVVLLLSMPASNDIHSTLNFTISLTWMLMLFTHCFAKYQHKVLYFPRVSFFTFFSLLYFSLSAEFVLSQANAYISTCDVVQNAGVLFCRSTTLDGKVFLVNFCLTIQNFLLTSFNATAFFLSQIENFLRF